MNNTEKQWSFWQLLKEHRIEIPMLQRDYAQGRADEKGKVSPKSQEFAKKLVESIQNQSPLHLDFIYGKVRGKDSAWQTERNQEAINVMLKAVEGYASHLKVALNYEVKAPAIEVSGNTFFIPLDGQQRLTTLFLLHWYLARQMGHSPESDEAKVLSKFSYQTRPGARDFCQSLITQINFSVTDGEIGKSIADASWFYTHWRYDPTVSGMLAMLNEIDGHLKMANRDQLQEYWQSLTGQTPAITFHFLDMEYFELTDELYLKMNARGKELSAFEQFKAAIEKELDTTPNHWAVQSIGPNKKVALRKYFAQRIDTSWTGWFWQNREPHVFEIDDYFMRLAHAFLVFHLMPGHSEQNTDFDKAFEKLRSRDYKLTYNTHGEFSVDVNEWMSHFADFLDLMVKRKPNVKAKPSHERPDHVWFNEGDVLKKIMWQQPKSNEGSILTYEEYLLFYAFYGYVLHEYCRNQPTDTHLLKRWTRVVYNLVFNTRIDSITRFVNALHSLRSLFNYRCETLEYLSRTSPFDASTFVETGNTLKAFYEPQVEEERVKALLILKSNDWKQLILQAESHEYFRGQIGFLLHFSGIMDQYRNHEKLDWHEREDGAYRLNFESYYQKCALIFDRDGLSSKIPDFLWERALLTKGAYFLQKSANLSFLVAQNRYISWKRLLRGDTNIEKSNEQRNLVKTLLDNINIDKTPTIEQINEALKAVINRALPTMAPYDPLTHLVKKQKLIAYCEQRYLRSAGSTYYLLKGQRTSGKYVEVFTYGLFLEWKLRSTDFHPYRPQYNEESRGEDKPCIFFSNGSHNDRTYHVYVAFDTSLGQFEVGIHAEDHKMPSQELEEQLFEQGYDKRDQYYFKNTDRDTSPETKVMELLSHLTTN